MPSVSKRQHRFMAANCAKAGGKIPQDIACEFMHADKGKKVANGKRKKRTKK